MKLLLSCHPNEGASLSVLQHHGLVIICIHDIDVVGAALRNGTLHHRFHTGLPVRLHGGTMATVCVVRVRVRDFLFEVTDPSEGEGETD